MSKDEGGRNSSLSEKPVRSRLRRLADWINLTGAKKVHSLIDKVYKRKNLEMAGRHSFIFPRARFVVRCDRECCMHIPKRSRSIVSWTRYGSKPADHPSENQGADCGA